MMSSATRGQPRRPRRVEMIALVHLRALGERVIFGVLDDREIEGARVLERAAHDRARGHAAPVVADARPRRRPCRSAISVSSCPFWPMVMAPMGWSVGPPTARGARDHHLGDGARVVHRAGVGHRADVGEAARGRGREAA